MHEATIAQSILNIAFNRMRNTPNANAVLSIYVIIGEFRNVDIDSLTFAFDSMKAMHDGCGACTLEAEIVKSKAYCAGGAHIYHPEFENAFRCPDCGDGIGKLICGEEFDVIRITLQAESSKEQSDYARVG